MKREIIPAQRIAQSLYLLRGQRVLLDSDLAALYGVPTGHLKRAVKRNTGRFPTDYVSAQRQRGAFFEMPNWHLKAGSRCKSLPTLRFHRATRGHAFKRAQQRADRGAHATRVLAMATSPSRTCRASQKSLPHISLEKDLFGESPKRARESRALPSQ